MKNPATHPEVASPHSPSVAGWLFPLLFLALAGGVLAVAGDGATHVTRLLPTRDGAGGLPVLDALTFFLILLAPCGWRRRADRGTVLDGLVWAVCVACAVGFALALVSRVMPIHLPWALRAGGAAVLFAWGSFYAYQIWAEGYVAVQLLLAGMGPFAGWLLGQMVQARTGAAVSWPWLYVTSMPAAFRMAVSEDGLSHPVFRTTMLLWGGLTVVAGGCLWLRGPVQKRRNESPPH